MALRPENASLPTHPTDHHRFSLSQSCCARSVSQGSHSTWKTLKIWNFVMYFSRLGKCLEFAQKVVKIWNFNSKPGERKNMPKKKIGNSMFQDSLFKMWFTKYFHLHFCHIYIINTTSSNPNLSGTSLHLFYFCYFIYLFCLYLEITW